VVTSPPLRVLVVDDSAYNRKNIADILTGGSDEVEIVGKAGDGDEALRYASQLRPDVITLDLEMPRMDGFTFLRILMARQPTPVIVISSYSNKENVFKALELGAIDFVAKPDRQFSPDTSIRREILSKVLLVRSLRPLTSLGAVRHSHPAPSRSLDAQPAARSGGVPRYIVGIASSTGGPSALLDLFSRIPERFPGAILIAQHMPDKFTKTFAERLDKKGAIRVVEAQDGDLVTARRAYVCPGKMCMELTGSFTPTSQSDLRLRVMGPVTGDRYIPSADRLLKTVASVAGSRSIGVILTGMGDDGVAGARAIRAAGGTVIAESEETAVVYGMPGAAVRAGIVSEGLALPAIGEFIAQLT
jgi:two-component system, chemotaxis family, protein-glutamate methylesterase/glutaminase